MTNTTFQKIFVFFIIGLIFSSSISPVSLAAEGGQKSSSSKERTVSEIKINVSEDGRITFLDAYKENKFTEFSPEATLSTQSDNTCSGAYPLDLGTKYYAYINYKGDVDWYKFDLPSPGFFRVVLEVPSGYDYDLKVYGTCEIRYCTSEKGKGSNEECYVYAPTNPIYVKVYGWGSYYSESDKYYIKGTFEPATSYDLVPGSFIITPSSPTKDDSIKVVYYAVNTGPDDITDDFYVKFYIDDTLYQTCHYTDGLDFLGLAVCERSGIKLSAGTHTLKNVVDTNNDIDETNENNNVLEESLTVSQCPPDKPNYWDGSCHECEKDYPYFCGGTCRQCQNPSDVFTCYNNEPYCCPSNNPYYCARTGGCWATEERCDTAMQCGGSWWACNDAAYEEKCVDNKPGCCLPQYPFYCPENNFCFGQGGFCDGRPVYDCNGKYWVCIQKGDKGTCYGNELRCCPPEYPVWWETDNQCHASQYKEPSCQIKDGSSAECDCNKHSDCPASHPFCEEEYPSPISDGYDACLAEEPKYCGDGDCSGSENYANCPSDCESFAPKGKINVDVSYKANNKPISNAYVYSDDVLKGTTDSYGKKSFEASYGQRTIKTECPDKTLCETRTINVDGTEYVSFACSCNPPGDSDGDGNLDEEEKLLGTDPNDPNENFNSAFFGLNNPQGCLDIIGMISIAWKHKDDLIQANDIVIQALNNTEVMTTNIEVHPETVMNALVTGHLNADIKKGSVTLVQSLETSEEVGGFFTDYGAVLVMTDYETQTTAVIAIGASCVGYAIGGLYGAGTGIKDDVVGIWILVTGLWNFINNNPAKIVDDVAGFLKSIPQLFGKAGEIFHDMIISILEKGRSVAEKSVLFTSSNRESYHHFQVGFVNGFVTGYVLEQITATFIGAGAILKALKLGNIASKTGKILKLPALLAKITEEHGGEVASVIKKLKYAEKVAEWTEEEANSLARIIKLKQGKWLGELSEAEAKFAAKHVDDLVNVRKFADADIEKLLNTNIGRKTLTVADTTNDLLAKQIKLINKWGASQLEEVTKRFDGFWPWQKNGWKKVNELVGAMPETLVSELNTKKAITFLGDKEFVDVAKKIAEQVDDVTMIRVVTDIDGYEKLIKYSKAVRKLDPAIANPMGDIGKHQLLKVITTTKVSTKVGDTTIDGMAVLKRGDAAEGWGWEHIIKGDHHNQIKKALGLADNDGTVKDVIAEVIQSPDTFKYVPGEKFEFVKRVRRGSESFDIKVVVSDRPGQIGSVQTAHPI